jgi:hypothetical protein
MQKKQADSQVTGKNLEGDPVTVKQSMPFQLSLFQCLLPDNGKYSNTIELYDAIPKYFSSPKKMAELRHSGRFLDILEREFRHRDTSYKVEITPARLKRQDNSQIEYYPTTREELVEEALRKIATDERYGLYIDNEVGVKFTLYQLQNELKRMGHAIKYTALMESLTICNRSNINLTRFSDSHKPVFSSAIFPVFIRSHRDDWIKDPKNTYCYIQFNTLITQSLKQLTYRQFDYEKYMQYVKPLSRWLHKRLSHNFTQASLLNHYEIKASTIIRDSGLIGYEGVMRKQIAEIENALDELKEKKAVAFYKTEKRYNDRKITDAIYSIKPSYELMTDIINANKHNTDLIDQAYRYTDKISA